MSTIVTRSGKGSPLTNTEVDSNFTNLNTDKAELSGAVFTGAITTNSTIDGRDVAADGVTADAALPKAGGAMTGAITTNSTFDGVDIATRDAVLTSTTTTANAALPKAGGVMSGAITTNSTFDGRDVATDGTKLDGIEASADVTDATNVTAAGALMDSELTSIVAVKALNQGVATGDSPTFVAVTGTLATAAQTNITSVGTLSALTVTGEITANGGIALGDSDKATFGASDDLQIYHDGSHSYVGDYGTGNLSVTGNNLYLQNTAGETYFSGISDGAVSLYHNNLAKLATTSTGIAVTGSIRPTSHLYLPDTAGAIFGTGEDLEIYHDASDSYIKESGTGNLLIQGSDIYMGNTSSNHAFVIRNSGNVLVGQTSAGANGKLQVTGGISTTGNSEIRQSTNSDGSTLKFLGTQLVIGNTNANGYNYSGGGLIGSVSPSASQIMLDVGAVSTSGHRLKVINGADGVAGSLQYLSGSDVRFKVDSSSGNVNVGGVLELQSNNSGFPTTGMVLNQNNFVYLRGGSNGLIMGKAGDNEAMRINSGGNLLLNGNSDLDASHIAIHQHSNKNGITFKAPNTSSYMALQFQNNSGGRIGYIQYSNTATSYSTSSDYRLKENVVPMTGSIDRVKALKPSRFNFIVDADKTVDGFLAHEAQEIVPECATGTKDAMRDEEYEVTAAVEEVRDEDDNITTEAVEAVMGSRSVPDYQGIDQAKLVPLLVAALQEAIARIEILEG
jgi:hypothetical protein